MEYSKILLYIGEQLYQWLRPLRKNALRNPKLQSKFGKRTFKNINFLGFLHHRSLECMSGTPSLGNRGATRKIFSLWNHRENGLFHRGPIGGNRGPIGGNRGPIGPLSK